MPKIIYDNEITRDIDSKRKVTIYSHGDFDGIASAALFLYAFVPSDIKTNIVSVNYDIEKEWPDYPFDNTSFNVVLDFKLSNSIDVWIDHHLSGKTLDCREPKYFVYDPNQPSAVHCVLKLIKSYQEKFIEENGEMLDEYLKWARIIDAAQYDSAEQVLKSKDNAILFDKAYQLLKKPYDFFVKSLHDSDLNFDNVIKNNPLFRACGDRQTSNDWKCFYYAKENGQISKSGIIFLDLIDSNVQFSRYVAWEAFKKDNPLYCITCYKLTKNSYGISVSKNPFIKVEDDRINLASMAEKYGGGGHAKAIGINAKSPEEIYKIIESFANELDELLKQQSLKHGVIQ